MKLSFGEAANSFASTVTLFARLRGLSMSHPRNRFAGSGSAARGDATPRSGAGAVADLGPLEATKPWSMRGVEGVSRFLARVWRLTIDDRHEAVKLLDAVQHVDPDKETLR